MTQSSEFSYQSREKSLKRFKEETFDLLVIGGGITGAAVARDATTRGLRVALVERNDFASGTSSRSSKLIHGGLRYLENMEFSLVFEALSERALLLKTCPTLVRPLPFFLPVYEGDSHGKGILSCGMWLYDLLALFRTPGFHKGLSRDSFLQSIPFIKKEGLKGGFRYFDASMWDDVMAVETVRAAHYGGAAVANYVEAIAPIWSGDRVAGFRLRDPLLERGSGEIDLKAHRVVSCTGPWTDELGSVVSSRWQKILSPSKGVHLVFDIKKIPVPGALVMSHPDDGRISFVIPRPDLGAGVTLVGTTDGPSPERPERVNVEKEDVQYLMKLLTRYFPDLGLKESDILSAYVGVRPLVGTHNISGSEGQKRTLQKVSREHHIELGPGGIVIVAGGKYTTHRKMAEEIVDEALKSWQDDLRAGKDVSPLPTVGRSGTKAPMNPYATADAVDACVRQSQSSGINVPAELLGRYGSEAMDILEIHSRHHGETLKDPEGFPMLAAQLRHSIRKEMTLRLSDFYFRRLPLFLSRKDHGMPWAEQLSRVWAEERGLSAIEASREAESLFGEIARAKVLTGGF